MKFYKILNETENHHGLQYVTGLNIDPVPFDPSGSCRPGGIYFAREDILAYLNYGPWIREVIIPEGVEIYAKNGKFKAPQVVLGERRRIDAAVIQELIEEGADVDAWSNQALAWAAMHGRAEIVKILIENRADVSAGDNWVLQLMAEKGHADVVKILIANGADVSSGDNRALRRAAEKGHADVVKILIANGADVSAGDNI